jgi:hypothetical protein
MSYSSLFFRHIWWREHSEYFQCVWSEACNWFWRVWRRDRRVWWWNNWRVRSTCCRPSHLRLRTACSSYQRIWLDICIWRQAIRSSWYVPRTGHNHLQAHNLCSLSHAHQWHITSCRDQRNIQPTVCYHRREGCQHHPSVPVDLLYAGICGLLS